MTPLQIAPDLYKIVVPTPFPVGPVNLYLAIGPEGSLSLIDTGPRTDQAHAVLERSLADLNYTFADIQRIMGWRGTLPRSRGPQSTRIPAAGRSLRTIQLSEIDAEISTGVCLSKQAPL
jgi:hypothetical protein